MILLVVFIVTMLLWGISLLTALPTPLARAAGVCGWISVLCLFLMIHPLGLHG